MGRAAAAVQGRPYAPENLEARLHDMLDITGIRRPASTAPGYIKVRSRSCPTAKAEGQSPSVPQRYARRRSRVLPCTAASPAITCCASSRPALTLDAARRSGRATNPAPPLPQPPPPLRGGVGLMLPPATLSTLLPPLGVGKFGKGGRLRPPGVAVCRLGISKPIVLVRRRRPLRPLVAAIAAADGWRRGPAVVEKLERPCGN